MAKIGPKEAQRRALRVRAVIAPLRGGASKLEKLGLLMAKEGTSKIVEEQVARTPEEMALAESFFASTPDAKVSRGRPALKLTNAQRAERKRVQTRKRVRALRARKRKEKK